MQEKTEALLSAGLSEKIMNFGMTFLHESLHTRAGAKSWDPNMITHYRDPVNESSTLAEKQAAFDKRLTGDVVDRINKIRDEIGVPTRESYVAPVQNGRTLWLIKGKGWVKMN